MDFLKKLAVRMLTAAGKSRKNMRLYYSTVYLIVRMTVLKEQDSS